MDVSVVYENMPKVVYRQLSNGRCAVWIDNGSSNLDLIFSDHKDLGILIRALERVYREGNRKHDR